MPRLASIVFEKTDRKVELEPVPVQRELSFAETPVVVGPHPSSTPNSGSSSVSAQGVVTHASQVSKAHPFAPVAGAPVAARHSVAPRPLPPSPYAPSHASAHPSAAPHSVAPSHPSPREATEQGPRVVDATVLGQTLFSLDEQGKVHATALSHRQACSLPPLPGRAAALHSVGRNLVVRTEDGGMYITMPCGAHPTWHKQGGALGERGIRHISTSPDGRHIWLQDATHGFLFQVDTPEGQPDAWNPVDRPITLGSEEARRYLGDGGQEFVDVLRGRAIRNGKKELTFEVPHVVYPGQSVGTRGPSDGAPLGTKDASKKRVAPGKVATFPVRLDVLVRQLSQ